MRVHACACVCLCVSVCERERERRERERGGGRECEQVLVLVCGGGVYREFTGVPEMCAAAQESSSVFTTRHSWGNMRW